MIAFCSVFLKNFNIYPQFVETFKVQSLRFKVQRKEPSAKIREICGKASEGESNPKAKHKEIQSLRFKVQRKEPSAKICEISGKPSEGEAQRSSKFKVQRKELLLIKRYK